VIVDCCFDGDCSNIDVVDVDTRQADERNWVLADLCLIQASLISPILEAKTVNMADLRRLMKERAASKRIEHPYARYNNGGNLSCSLCSLAIKSEVLWPSHLTSKVHRSNVKKEKDAQQELEVQTATSSNGKRANEDEEMLHDGQDRQKRVRIDEAGSQEYAATSSFPPGFFDNPADAPASNDQDMPTSQENEEDPEWAAFEATLAEEDAPQASTSANGPGATASSYASATISAGEVLYGNGQEDEEAAQEGADEEEDENDEPKETEEERRDREEREELMERIETCVQSTYDLHHSVANDS